MKKVRFVTPTKALSSNMNEYDCHSPRPILQQSSNSNEPSCYTHSFKTVTYSSDPMHLYEYTNASPNPMARPTDLVSEIASKCYPTNELELTMLDGSPYDPRTVLCGEVFKHHKWPKVEKSANPVDKQAVLTPVSENFREKKMPATVKENSFFIRRDNIANFESQPLNSLPYKLQMMKINKENIPQAFKMSDSQKSVFNRPMEMKIATDCNCYHCNRGIARPLHCLSESNTKQQNLKNIVPKPLCNCANPIPYKNVHTSCSCVCLEPNCCMHEKCYCNKNSTSEMGNAVDKKNWAVEKYENTKKSANLEIEKQQNVSKEKREPTVADLFKIIKLQNEQLQLLQEKVDKFISASSNGNTPQPVQNYVTEHVASETVSTEKSKISIGVMTSFEVVRTSTIINKEVITTNENAQIQCNRSQISIKEVVSKAQPGNINFLDGLRPKDKGSSEKTNEKEIKTRLNHGELEYDEKTLNEQSLYNVQVDNATTPLMSPDQTLYLDVRDYSDSDSGSDHSNIGWTYYNKVMTHVNGMLQDSDMPSSASGLWRNTRQHCMQMQIDKTNVSVMKRVKFGEDVIVKKPTQNNVLSTTDTSFKMKQLAAKYLQSAPSIPAIEPATRPKETNEMSIATRNYMERHQIIQGTSPRPVYSEMPRFLDITALKQQPKYL